VTAKEGNYALSNPDDTSHERQLAGLVPCRSGWASPSGHALCDGHRVWHVEHGTVFTAPPAPKSDSFTGGGGWLDGGTFIYGTD